MVNALRRAGRAIMREIIAYGLSLPEGQEGLAKTRASAAPRATRQRVNLTDVPYVGWTECE